MERLTLNRALNEDRLEEFIVQAEDEGVGPIAVEEFDARIAGVVKGPPPEDQTSH